MEQDVPISEFTSLDAVLCDFVTELTKYNMPDMLHILRRAEMSMPQLSTLIFLRRRGARTLGDIREYLNLTLSATSQLVDRLVSAQYVTRIEDPHDRRQKRIALTDAGRAIVDEINRARVADMAQRLAELPPPVRDRLVDALTEAADYLRDNDVRTSSRHSRASS